MLSLPQDCCGGVCGVKVSALSLTWKAASLVSQERIIPPSPLLRPPPSPAQARSAEATMLTERPAAKVKITTLYRSLETNDKDITRNATTAPTLLLFKEALKSLFLSLSYHSTHM